MGLARALATDADILLMDEPQEAAGRTPHPAGACQEDDDGLDIVERPADDYLAEFVRHVNPAGAERAMSRPFKPVGARVHVAATRGEHDAPRRCNPSPDCRC